MLPTSFGYSNYVRCMSCGNALTNYRTDGAGSELWNGIAVSISYGKLYNYNSTTIDSSTDWK
jgi:hypothetical protein